MPSEVFSDTPLGYIPHLDVELPTGIQELYPYVVCACYQSSQASMACIMAGGGHHSWLASRFRRNEF